jgi:hypothetical protein
MEVSAQLHALAALPPEKDPLYPLDRGWEYSRRSVHWGGKKYLALPGIETGLSRQNIYDRLFYIFQPMFSILKPFLSNISTYHAPLK